MNIAFYQYRFFLQVGADYVACSRVISQDDHLLIERNHIFGQRSLDSILPLSSGPGSGIWLFTKKDNKADSEVNGRFMGISWMSKQWSPLKLWHGSSDYAMESMRLDQIRYLSVDDVSADKLPKRLVEALNK